MSVAVAAMLVGATVAACGSSTLGTQSSERRPGGAPADQSGLGYARCMRAHGVSRFPDPNRSGNGFDLAGAGIDQSSPAIRAAERACRSLLPTKRVSNQAPTAAAYTRLLRWARCMRSHGISALQDPKPNPPPGPGSPGANPFGTVMGDGGYWIGIPGTVNAHSSGFARLSTRCGESTT